MADTAVATAVAPVAAAGGDAAHGDKEKRERRPRQPRAAKNRATAASGDAAPAENDADTARPRGRNRNKAHAPPAMTQTEGGGCAQAQHAQEAAAGEPTKERGPKQQKPKRNASDKKPRERKPKPQGDRTDATGGGDAMLGLPVAADGETNTKTKTKTKTPPAPAREDGGAAAKREKTTKKQADAKPKRRNRDESAKAGSEKECDDESDGEPAERAPDVAVDWSTAAWYSGCDADLGSAYWLLTRCYSCNDTTLLERESLVRRAVALQKLVGRLKTELLPQDEHDDDEAHDSSEKTKTEWTAAEILTEVVAVLQPAQNETSGETSMVMTLLEGEVVEAATDLLIGRTGREDLALLEKWEAHLAAILPPPSVPTAKMGKSKGKERKKSDVAAEEKQEEAALEHDGDREQDGSDDGDDEGEAVESPATPPTDDGDVTAAAALPSPRQRRRNAAGGAFSAKAQVTAAIAFHKSYEQRAVAVAANGTVSTEVLAQWTAEIQAIYDSTLVGPGDESKRKGVAAQIESAFRRAQQWRHCEVLLFGSSLSKFGSKTSDLDLCLRANPGKNDEDLEETKTSMSVRELRLRMRRMQKELDGETLSADGVSRNDDAPFLAETLDKSRKTVEALANTAAKQLKKTKNKDSAKLKRLQLLAAHWQAIVEALAFFYGRLEASAGGVERTNRTSETKAAAAAYHAAAHKQQKQRQRDIYAAAALLGRNGCDVDLVVAHARVPVIGFTHRASGLECDLCFENYHACVNTLLLRTYAEVDDRARALGLAIKHWAKRRGLNDASTGHLSSYSFILLVIYFLQTKAHVLPNLQHPDLLRAASVAPIKLNGVDVSFCNDVSQARAFHAKQHQSPNAASVGELLLNFFQFYVNEFDFSQHVVSVRHPETLVTKRVRWGKNKLKAWRVSIEDPLEMDRDLGSVLQFRCQHKILDEMKRALRLLSDGDGFETRVCEAVPSAKPNDKAANKAAGKKQQQQKADAGGNKAKAKGGNDAGNKSDRNGKKEKPHDAGKPRHGRQQQSAAGGDQTPSARGRGDRQPRAKTGESSNEVDRDGKRGGAGDKSWRARPRGDGGKEVAAAAALAPTTSGV